MGKFILNIQKNGSNFSVKVNGTIDEDADFTPHALSGAENIELDLSGVKGINSCGIREWIKWISTNQSGKIVFNQCPKVIVDQINMVDGFLPSNAKVESFFVPYYNDDSGEEKNVLFRYGNEFKEGQLIPPDVVKDAEGNAMEMDVIEAKYFKFIKR